MNWSVVSLVNASGNVVQRTSFTPYGEATFLTTSWSPTTDACNQKTLFQGGQLTSATGLYEFQMRDYDPQTGTWKEQDPGGYIDGMSRYQFGRSRPVDDIDPSGFVCCDKCKPGSKQLTDVAVELWPALHGNPNAVQSANSAIDATDVIDKIVAAGGIASSPTELKDILLGIGDAAIGNKMEDGWTDAMQSAAQGWVTKLAQEDGVFIFVRVKWNTCEKVRCFFFWSHYDWVTHDSNWVDSQVTPAAADTPVAGGGFNVNDVKVIGNATPGAVKGVIKQTFGD